MCDFAKETLGFDLMNASLEHLQNAPKADLVIALQVMAHFVAPQVAATQIANLTKPGGWLLVETWNHRSRTARLFGKHWHEYSPPTVVQWFSPKSLERLMSQHGFEKVAAGRPKKFIRSEHAVSLLRYKIDSIPIVRWGSPLLRLIPEKLNIPYPSEDLFWMLFQRSENA
jgi:SAM-dependent methyltransferase